jgi:hypothetical protein
MGQEDGFKFWRRDLEAADFDELLRDVSEMMF